MNESTVEIGADGVAPEVHRSFCRTCPNWCAVTVTTRGNHVVEVAGDHDDPLYRGYTCNKGRAHGRFYDHPERVTTSLVRGPDGNHAPIDADAAIDAIAVKLRRIIEESGPRAVACYSGSYLYMEHSANLTMLDAFMRALGTPMHFTTMSIDQSGKAVAGALHGKWLAPFCGALEPEAILLIGNNPLVSHTGFPGNPGDFYRDIEDRDAALIVIDPRRTETARRARLHLQSRPGHDVALLAAMLRVILDEGLHDHDFLAENVDGVGRLRAAVGRFDPVLVADSAGVPAEDLIAAARLYGSARRGYAAAGTGPNMSGNPSLLEYLVLCMQTVCGHWSRAGDPIPNAPTLTPARPHLAQALDPFPAFGYGERSRVRGLGETGNGMPTATAAEEILLEGPGQVRALLSLGGNPVTAFPDQRRTVDALQRIELLVHTDVMMSATARMSHYVVGVKLPYEMPSTTFMGDFLVDWIPNMGFRRSYSRYTPAVVDAPPGVIDHTDFLFRLAQRMGLQLEVYPSVGAAAQGGEPVPLDMDRDLDRAELLQIVHRGSRLPLSEVMAQTGGKFRPEPRVAVGPKAEGWQGRLQVGDPTMMRDLTDVPVADTGTRTAEYPFRLISRRLPHVFNSPTVVMPDNRPPYNPAFLHPEDLADLGLASGETAQISSARATITAVVQADPSVRRGVISMSHSWGGPTGTADEHDFPGACTGLLIDNQVDFDPYTGQPRMSNIPVSIVPTAPGAELETAVARAAR